MDFFAPEDCGITFVLVVMFIFIAPHVVLLCKFLMNIALDKRPHKVARSFLYFLWMWMGEYVMGLMYVTSLFSVDPLAFTLIPPVPLIASIISTMCMVVRPRQIFNESYEAVTRTRKDWAIDIIMFFVWMAIQMWVLLQLLVKAGLI